MPKNTTSQQISPASSAFSSMALPTTEFTNSDLTKAGFSSCVPNRPIPIGQLASLLHEHKEENFNIPENNSNSTISSLSTPSKISWNSVIGLGSTSSLLLFPDDLSRSTSAPPAEALHIPSTSLTSSPTRTDKGLDRPKASVIGPAFNSYGYSNTNAQNGCSGKLGYETTTQPPFVQHKSHELTSHPNYAAYYYSRSRLNPRLPPPVYTPGQSWHHLWNNPTANSSNSSSANSASLSSNSGWPYPDRKSLFQTQNKSDFVSRDGDSSSTITPNSLTSTSMHSNTSTTSISIHSTVNGSDSTKVKKDVSLDETEHIKATLRHLSLDCSADFSINRQGSPLLNNASDDPDEGRNNEYYEHHYDHHSFQNQHHLHNATDYQNSDNYDRNFCFSDETSNLFNSFRPYSTQSHIQSFSFYPHKLDQQHSPAHGGSNVRSQHASMGSKYSTPQGAQPAYFSYGGSQQHHGGLKVKNEPSEKGQVQHQQVDKNLDSPDSPTSSLLEEFRASKGTRRFSVKEILSCVVEFSGDQFGSRFIQQKLESCTPEEKDQIFCELLSHSVALMTDVFGNYVIQKFFELGSLSQKCSLVQNMQGHVLSLSLQMYGCRVVQKALENLPTESQSTLISELSGHVIKCVKDQNGNHVIQKCIERVPSDQVQFVVDSFKGQVCHLAMHPYGCRVLQRIFEHCSSSQSIPLLAELFEHIDVLVLDQYGNYVIQHVLERGSSHDKSKVIACVRGRLVELSRHKFASNVVEKSMAYANSSDRRSLVDEILAGGVSVLSLMMKDPFANYVVQRMLDVADQSQRSQLVQKIKPQLAMLRKYTYGKHIIAKVERIMADDPSYHHHSGSN